jgi:capsular polysaccharide biosynthesis protein
LSSTALVLLSSDSSTTSQVDIATEIRIVGSTPVLQEAGESVTPALSAAALARRVTVDAPTPQLIEIRATSTYADEARSLSQAVAQAYVSIAQRSAERLTEEVLGDLGSRESALTRQLKALESEISAASQRVDKKGPNSAADRRDAQLLTRLTAEQSDISLQLDKVKEAIAATGVTNEGSASARIIQPASPPVGPGLYRRLLFWGSLGALGGIAGAAGLLLIWARRDTRLRARDDLADAVGGRVLADVRSRRQRSVAEWATLLETYKASAVDAWAFRQMLRSLAARDADEWMPSGGRRAPWRVEHPRSLTVISLSGDSGGLAVGPQLAAFAASLGITTRLVVSVGHTSAAALWAACLADRASELRPGLLMHSSRGVAADDNASRYPEGPTHPNGVARPRPANGSVLVQTPRGEEWVSPQLALRSVTGAEGVARSIPTGGGSAETGSPDGGTHGAHAGAPLPTSRRDAVDFTIVLAVADRKQPTLQEVPATAATVLAVSPGVATREELARLAVACDDAGHRLDGVVVADPDAADRTTGRRTMDERVRQTSLPVRLTGLGQIPTSPSDRDPSR